MLARAKGAAAPSARKQASTKQKPKLKTFIENRDFVGASTFLEFERRSGKATETTVPWLVYTTFHAGEYKRAAELVEEMLASDDADPNLHTFLAACYFYLGMFKEAEQEALKAPSSRLQVRILFQVSHRLNDENKLMSYHQRLQDCTEDQLTLAAIHCLRGHFQEAADVYRRLLSENRDFLALNVYLALCYYRLDFNDASIEVLQAYLQRYPTSLMALNLKACNTYKLFNGRNAEAELRPLIETMNLSSVYGGDLIRHNLVVFRSGEGAVQVLPRLIDVLPEARLNLVIYYLRREEYADAYKLMQDVEPTSPHEYILKGLVNAAVGQENDSKEHLRIAQQYLQLVGSSPTECDTIPGRQCMASCFFLVRQWDDVLLYMRSIKTYLYSDDDFNWNFGQSLAASGQWHEAEETLLLVTNPKLTSDYVYISWLARCYIRNRKPTRAWELYKKLESTAEGFGLLQLIANDCYKMGAFYYAAQAFDVLERLDPNPEFWEGKRGACVAVFQQVLAQKESRDVLRDVVAMLRNSQNAQVEYIVRVIRKWARENNVRL